MKVVLLSYTKDPEILCGAAARSCYSEKGASEIIDEITEEKARKVVAHVRDMGHHSILEHATFTFSIEGVSRVLTHQLVRHRMASYSQQSQRYVKVSEANIVEPPKIKENKEAHEVFEKVVKEAKEAYQKLLDLGVPAEDARFILPQGIETNIVVTMNARELWHFFTLRTCFRAQWEINQVAWEMLRLVKEVAPELFRGAGPACIRGPCPEGPKNCGWWRTKEARKLREEYRQVRYK
ncbi:MAG: FAD-dependent thymidylate synthase [Thermoprotei archaeon]|nr:MAG: FAD-dependent thymidylate synthase [Thermoprotei archaeon]